MTAPGGPVGTGNVIGLGVNGRGVHVIITQVVHHQSRVLAAQQLALQHIELVLQYSKADCKRVA